MKYLHRNDRNGLKWADINTKGRKVDGKTRQNGKMKHVVLL
jgi:hypothetical protein